MGTRTRLVAVRLLLIALTACAAGPDHSTSDSSVQFRVSKPHALINVAQAIAGDAHRSPILREAFARRPPDERVAAILRRFDAARRSLQGGVSFDGYPVERRMGRTLDKVLLVQSAFATDLDDLGQRTAALLPIAEQHELLGSLRELEPIYDAVIWNEHRAALELYRDRLTAQARAWQIESLFERARSFYGAQWPADLTFVIALYPLPGSQGTTSAESIANVESVGVLLAERDLSRRFGVIFHEMCHSLWEAQPAALQREIEGSFTSSRSRHARLAYLHFNEALATALGNGWAQSRATGALDPGEWYADAYVDRYAKELHPLVEPYLEQGRTLDHELVAGAIDRFAAAFPDAIYVYEQILNKMLLMLDGRSLSSRDVIRELQARFRVSSVSSSVPIDHERSLAQVGATGETLVVVVSQAAERQLDALAAVYPPVAAGRDALAREPSRRTAAGVDELGRAWIVIRADGIEALRSALDEMKAQARI